MHSQNNEEEIILSWFKSRGFTEKSSLPEGAIGLQKLLINSSMTYLDIGANQGTILSNTYALALNGCSGYAVEASKKAFEQLKENYKNLSHVELYNIAITSDKEGDIEFWESGTHLGQGDLALLSTTHESELKRWDGSNNVFEKTTAIAIPFEKFYEGLPWKQILFISLDIEGEDLYVLRKMDLTAMGTQLVCLEHNSIPEVKQAMIEYCASHGLVNVLLENAENIIISK